MDRRLSSAIILSIAAVLMFGALSIARASFDARGLYAGGACAVEINSYTDPVQLQILGGDSDYDDQTLTYYDSDNYLYIDLDGGISGNGTMAYGSTVAEQIQISTTPGQTYTVHLNVISASHSGVEDGDNPATCFGFDFDTCMAVGHHETTVAAGDLDLFFFIRIEESGASEANIQWEGEIWIDDNSCTPPTPTPSPTPSPTPTIYPVITSTYCLTGTEAVTTPIQIADEEEWTKSVETGYGRGYVKYTLSGDTPPAAVILQLNDSIEYWHEVGPDTETYEVPIISDADDIDYHPNGMNIDPTADLRVANHWMANGELTLYSACIMPPPVQDGGPRCPDGVEMIQDGLVIIDKLHGTWEASTYVTFTHVVIRFAIQSLSGRGLETYSEVEGAEYTRFWYHTFSPVRKNSFITHTIPISASEQPVVPASGTVTARYQNFSVGAIALHSACIMDAADIPRPDQISAANCHLDNPDFSESGAAWTTSGGVAFTTGAADPADYATLTDGIISQSAKQSKGNVYDLEVRAWSASGNTDIEYGVQATSLASGGPQLYAQDLDGALTSYEKAVFVPFGESVQISGAGNVDYVCLWESEHAAEPACGPFPNYNLLYPETDNVPLKIEFGVKYVGDVLTWVVCELTKPIVRLYNFLVDAWEEARLILPAFPTGEDSGIMGWLQWLRLAIERLGDTLVVNVAAIANWLPSYAESFSGWLARLLWEIAAWLVSLVTGSEPGDVQAAFNSIWSTLNTLIDMILFELLQEFADLMTLAGDTADIFIILWNGFYGAATGSEVAPIGKNVSGVGEFIWIGIDWANSIMETTPITAINVIALSIIALGLAQFTIREFLTTLEAMTT